MALNHLDALWTAAERPLIENVARALCARHGSEIFGPEAVTSEFLDDRWIFFSNDAADAIAITRHWDQFPNERADALILSHLDYPL